MAANVMGREVDPTRNVVGGPIATMLAVPCWSSWKAAVCAIQATVERDHPSWDETRNAGDEALVERNTP